jgi:hypothetical protein
MQWIAANEPVSAFDFKGNGRIDFNDIVKLFGEILSTFPCTLRSFRGSQWEQGERKVHKVNKKTHSQHFII